MVFYVDWFAIALKHVRKSNSKSENKLTTTRKRLASPHFVILPFIVDTEKKRYTAEIARQAVQEEVASSFPPTTCNSGHVIDSVQLNYAIYVHWQID